MRKFHFWYLFFTFLALSGCQSNNLTYPTYLYDRIDNISTRDLNTEIPLPGEYIHGKYDNGIKFYIRHNYQPTDRVHIRLILRAGSLLESEQQQGFAHFVEHMAFNGTEDFSQQEIIEFVESVGMQFGSHLNAFTSFDNTFYQLELPAGDPKTLEMGLRIIENWAHKLSFEAEEIDRERGVILEEWRARLNVYDRLNKLHLAKIIPDSRWVNRFPIGQIETIENGSHEHLIDFYRQWYRPELMSVAVIGDVDVLEVAEIMDTYIAAIPASESPIDEQSLYSEYDIEPPEQPLVTIEFDEEVNTSQFSLMSLKRKKSVKTFADLREQYVIGLYVGMMNNRLYELTLSDDYPTLNASVAYSNYYGNYDVYSLNAGAKTGRVEEAIRAILKESYRSAQYGFSETELTRLKQTWLSDLQQSAKQIHSQVSSDHMNRLFTYIVKDYPTIDSDDALAFAQRVLPTITVEEVNSIASLWSFDDNKIFKASAPKSEQSSFPNADRIMSIWDEVANMELAEFQEKVLPDSLMAHVPTPGKIVNKEYISEGDYHRWTLSNGVTVILKPANFVSDLVDFYAVSEGGYSLVSDDTYVQTRLADQIIDTMGVGDIDFAALGKILSDKTVSLSSSIKNLYESMSGRFDINDVSEFMQLLHLKFTDPRMSQQHFDNYLAYIQPQVANQFNAPSARFSRVISQMLYGDATRYQPFDLEAMEQLDFQSSFNFYQQRFENAADFTFVIVGDFTLDQIESSIESYIASLPASEEKETYRVFESDRQPGDLSVRIYENTEPRAEVYLDWQGEFEHSYEAEFAFGVIRNALDTELREVIREQKSAAYYVGVNGYASKIPVQEFNLNVSFSCDPERVDELLIEVKRVVNDVLSGEVEQRYIDNYIVQKTENRALDLKTNQHWLGYLYQQEKQLGLSHEQYEATLKGLSNEAISSLATHILNAENTLQAVMMPKP